MTPERAALGQAPTARSGAVLAYDAERDEAVLVGGVVVGAGIALAVADLGADCLRINPGNIGSDAKVREVVAAAESGAPAAKWLGLIAVTFASINIFGGFAVTERMLAMYKKKERK